MFGIIALQYNKNSMEPGVRSFGPGSAANMLQSLTNLDQDFFALKIKSLIGENIKQLANTDFLDCQHTENIRNH